MGRTDQRTAVGFDKDVTQEMGGIVMSREEYLESLDKAELLAIIKYGLIESNAPQEVTVEDIYELIGCHYISEIM